MFPFSMNDYNTQIIAEFAEVPKGPWYPGVNILSSPESCIESSTIDGGDFSDPNGGGNHYPQSATPVECIQEFDNSKVAYYALDMPDSRPIVTNISGIVDAQSAYLDVTLTFYLNGTKINPTITKKGYKNYYTLPAGRIKIQAVGNAANLTCGERGSAYVKLEIIYYGIYRYDAIP